MGRKKTGKTPVRNFRMNETDYQAFCAWCKARGLKPTQVIRSLIQHHYVGALLEELEIKNLKELKEE